MDHETLGPLRHIRRYRATKRGPEAKLMRALKAWALSEGSSAQWAACGFAIGASEPDLLMVSCRPEVQSLRNMTTTHARLLAYLAEVEAAQPSTIARRSGSCLLDIQQAFDDLVAAGAVVVLGRSVSLSPAWRRLLPDTVAVEAKVSDWRRGAAQAARNRVFAQRSFLALPEPTANRVHGDPLIERLGLGVLAVNTLGTVRLVRHAPRQSPLIWFYYYSLAVAVAASLRRPRRRV